ncbi:hypothetical protein EGR_06042 [Echinococcus granulosus]|uniref:Uncharacterized protein n=1 Tax=Echinococcus granulosus TaxID=6210 RepID=W6UCP5_ECHGR|nr:hypothetical protein EGR_06042 [Echinococcus granulosus]EUB59050.1 hypothetical protein EGR_06042 [Echinococcus granulosus]
MINNGLARYDHRRRKVENTMPWLNSFSPQDKSKFSILNHTQACGYFYISIGFISCITNNFCYCLLTKSTFTNLIFLENCYSNKCVLCKCSKNYCLIVSRLLFNHLLIISDLLPNSLKFAFSNSLLLICRC